MQIKHNAAWNGHDAPEKSKGDFFPLAPLLALAAVWWTLAGGGYNAWRFIPSVASLALPVAAYLLYRWLCRGRSGVIAIPFILLAACVFASWQAARGHYDNPWLFFGGIALLWVSVKFGGRIHTTPGSAAGDEGPDGDLRDRFNLSMVNDSSIGMPMGGRSWGGDYSVVVTGGAPFSRGLPGSLSVAGRVLVSGMLSLSGLALIGLAFMVGGSEGRLLIADISLAASDAVLVALFAGLSLGQLAWEYVRAPRLSAKTG